MPLLELPDRTYRGQRVERDTFEQCYRVVFDELEPQLAADDVLLAFEVWDAELRTDRTVLEVLRG